MTRSQTVVELPEFQRRAKSIMSNNEREAAINYVAANLKRAFLSAAGFARSASRGREVAKAVGLGRCMYLVEPTYRSF